jgi:hypothetical protein
MNGRVVIAVVGVLTVFLGVYGLVRPDGVLAWVGLDLLNTNRRAGLVEARAVYGGLFLVLGVFTLWAAISPRRHRGELLLIACLWLGMFGGRMVGVSIEGSPGLLNTLGALFELVVGCLLLAAPFVNGGGQEPPEPAA